MKNTRSTSNGAQAAVAQLNGQSKDPTVTVHDPAKGCRAVCPLHGTDHAADGGWIEVHNPLHPRQWERSAGAAA